MQPQLQGLPWPYWHRQPEAENSSQKEQTNGEKDTMESKKKKRKVRDNNDNIIAIDFCCGSGHVGLALAAMRRDITVILIDCNPISIALAQSRAAEANVTNVKFLTMDIRDFNVQEYPGIRIGFALHACGPATDYALQKCLEANASYVFAPCCVGFIQNESDYARKLPCSRFFRDEMISHHNSTSSSSAVNGPDSWPCCSRFR